MTTDRIDSISAYCDRWCERCAFTERCSNCAVHVATTMCDGDVSAAIELAVGAPQPVDRPRPKTIGEQLLEEFGEQEIDEKSEAEFSRREAERDARVERLPVTRMARQYAARARPLLGRLRGVLDASADCIVRDALETVGWDLYLIDAKLYRALSGRDRHGEDDDPDEDPVQNDWNGSAKVALISIDRSQAAWRAIAGASGDAAAGALADALEQLARVVRSEFPREAEFIRPGFDEPWR